MATPAPHTETAPTTDPAATSQPDLVGIAAQVASKHAGGPATRPDPRAGRSGRKSSAVEVDSFLRKNGLKAVPAADPSSAPVDSAPSYVVDPAFVRQMAEMALKAVEAYRQRATYLRAVTIGADKDLAKELAEGNGAPPGAIEVISVSLAEISQKYGWLSQWTPEVAIIIAMGTWLGKDLATMRRLEAIRRQSKGDDESNGHRKA